MDAAALFDRIAARRRATADLLESLDDAQLATPSLCDAWTVREVAAHLTVPLAVPPARMALAAARHGGRFARANVAVARERGRRPVAELAAVLRERATSRWTPPGHGPAAPLTDLVVHTADMCVPLGRPHAITPDDAAAGFDLVTGFSLFIVPRGLLRGVRIAPTDLDRTWGDGAALTGPAADVLLAVFGRRGFGERVGGPGREVLAARRRSGRAG